MTRTISKAIVPAAGLGTRLLPATKSQPKEMLPVGRKPVIQYVVEELEEAGLDDIDVETRVATLVFDSGRAFFEDPVTRLLLVPELTESLGRKELERPMAYLRDAIDKYWSEGSFELTVHVGCASARK